MVPLPRPEGPGPGRDQRPAELDYAARVGYRAIDPLRYERRRYGTLRGRMNLALLRRAVRQALAGVAPGSLVLDAPCGTGIVGDDLAARGYRVVGLDISPAMLSAATGRARALGHVRGDLEQPPFPRHAFAAVICIRFLTHAPAALRPVIMRTLAELAQGPLVATVTHPYTVKGASRRLRGLLGQRPEHGPRLTRSELAAELDAAGLRLKRVIPVLPAFSDLWVVVAGH